jgi:Na+/melibiose symporter-like transporter
VALDIGNAPSQDEIRDYEEFAKARTQRCRGRALGSVIALVIAIAVNVPFSAGMPLHSHWQIAARFLMPVTMIAFLWCVYAVGLWWAYYADHHDFKKIYSSEEK